MNVTFSPQFKLVVAVLTAFLLGWLVRGVATDPHDAATISTYDDWRLACPPRAQPDAPCQLSQNILNVKTRTPILRVTLWRQKDKPMAGIVVPYNVLLPPGVGFKLDDGAAKTYPYTTCDQGGCVASVALETSYYRSLVHASKISVVVTTLSGKAVNVALSSKGLSAAAGAMAEAESGRTSWLRRILW